MLQPMQLYVSIFTSAALGRALERATFRPVEIGPAFRS
jgi:hypothetical protein